MCSSLFAGKRFHLVVMFVDYFSLVAALANKHFVLRTIPRYLLSHRHLRARQPQPLVIV
jgi:hypothetical protein